jgi:hypothetical protein
MARKFLVQWLARPLSKCEAPWFISANLRGFRHIMVLLLIRKQNKSVHKRIKRQYSIPRKLNNIFPLVI